MLSTVDDILTYLVHPHRQISIRFGKMSYQSGDFFFMSWGKKKAGLFPILKAKDLRQILAKIDDYTAKSIPPSPL